MRRSPAVSIGAAVLAFAATQHHNLHMMLIALGLGGSGMTFILAYPAVRRGMLLLSVAAAVVGLRSTLRGHAPPATRVITVAFSVLSLAIVGWSLLRLGL